MVVAVAELQLVLVAMEVSYCPWLEEGGVG